MTKYVIQFYIRIVQLPLVPCFSERKPNLT